MATTKKRARSRQLSLPPPKTWGGKRRGAGRKQVKARKSSPHRRRPKHRLADPVHVVIRVHDDIPTMRRRDVHEVVRKAMLVTRKRVEHFRIVHVSLQRNHVHLICEAADATALARGMQGFQVSCAKRLNRLLGRRGTVFIDRYHAVAVGSPTQCRNLLAYVFNNWRKHGEDAELPGWMLDPYSTGPLFRGWDEDVAEYAKLPQLPATSARTWLLKGGWRRGGSLDPWKRPGAKG